MIDTWMLPAGAAGIALTTWTVRQFLTEEVVVESHETAWVVKNGLRQSPLRPGVHRFWKPRLEVWRFDRRPQEMKVAGQEVMTRDRVGIKATVWARFRILDAVRFSEASQNGYGSLYAELQVALRNTVILFELEELLAARRDCSERVQAMAALRFATLGVELMEAQVIDLMLTGDLKRAMAEVAQARAEGQAKLERARSESAALRSMANAARLWKDNEGLQQLRTLQVAEKAAESVGNSLVWGVEDPSPKPKR